MSKEKIIAQAEKFAKTGKFEKAIKELQKAAGDDMLDMRVRLKIADLYARMKKNQEAIKQYIEVADFYYRKNFHLKAIAVYKAVLKLNPMFVEGNERLGDLYHEMGLKEDAINQYYIVAGFYDSKGVTREAMEIRKKIIEVDPASTTGRVRLAELLQSTGKTEESLREYEKAAELLKGKKDRDGLVEVYEKILYYRPENVALLIELGGIYFEKKEFKKALARIETASPSAKENLDVMELWAEALLLEHQVDQARRKFRDLYRQALESKDVDRAAKIYSRTLAEFSDDEDYLKELAFIQKETGVRHEPVTPKYREDFEVTQMVDLNEIEVKPSPKEQKQTFPKRKAPHEFDETRAMTSEELDGFKKSKLPGRSPQLEQTDKVDLKKLEEKLKKE
ncbi:MAG: tetratricopeptide repeat protein [Deltaproteobacteria bacterium]|nr:tetratricopeptide repeat protein [Deltaproteobacteria bacterium]